MEGYLSSPTLIGPATSGTISSGQVGNPHLASGAVQSGHIGSVAVVSGSIASGQLGGHHIASGGIISGKILSGSLTVFQLETNAIIARSGILLEFIGGQIIIGRNV